MTTEEVRQEINEDIVTNWQKSITAAVMNKVLNDMVDTLDGVPVIDVMPDEGFITDEKHAEISRTDCYIRLHASNHYIIYKKMSPPRENAYFVSYPVISWKGDISFEKVSFTQGQEGNWAVVYEMVPVPNIVDCSLFGGYIGTESETYGADHHEYYYIAYEPGEYTDFGVTVTSEDPFFGKTIIWSKSDDSWIVDRMFADYGAVESLYQSEVGYDGLYYFLGFDLFDEREEYEQGDYVVYESGLYVFTKHKERDTPWDFGSVEYTNLLEYIQSH